MAVIGTDVNDDIFIPEFQEDGQDENITVDNQDNIVSPDEGQETELDEDNQENQENQDVNLENSQKKYAGKFETVEDLEKAYQNLQPSFTKASQELSALRKQVVNPPVQQQVVVPGQGNNTGVSSQYPDVVNSIINEVYDRVNREVVAPLTQRLAVQDEVTNSMLIENELAKMSVKYDDFKEVVPVMMQVLNERQELLQLPDFLDVAYALGQKKVNEDKLSKKINSARNEAYKSREIKVLSNNVATNVKANQNTQKDSSQQIIDDILGLDNEKSIFKK